MEKKTAEDHLQPFEHFPDLQQSIEHAANNWKVNSGWSQHLNVINNICRELLSLRASQSSPSGAGRWPEITDFILQEAFDCTFNWEEAPLKDYKAREMSHDIKEAVRAGIEIYQERCAALSASGTGEEWTDFGIRKPDINRYILIVWPSGTFEPELRFWDGSLDSESGWAGIRWIYVPDWKLPAPPTK